MTTRRTLLKSAAIAVLMLGAPASGGPDGPIRAVATFSILGDMVSRIGGEHVAVTTLVGPNGDAHVYRPTPADARAVSEAHILVVNGLDFEGWLDRLIQASDFAGVHVVATAGIEPMAVEDDGDDHGHDGDRREGRSAEEHGDEHDGHHHGAFDPHAWQSLRHAVVYVDNITAALATADPDNAGTFYRNRAAYVAEIEALDADIRDMFADFPAGSRTIVTSHDAFQYFGRDYGLTFIAPQGLSTASEASARDVAHLIELIRDQGIRAVFAENVADPRLLKRIADETGTTIGGTLYPGALSGPDGPVPTYLDMMRPQCEDARAGTVVARGCQMSVQGSTAK